MKRLLQLWKIRTMSAEMSMPATNPCGANFAARARVLPCPKPTSRRRELGSSARSSRVRLLTASVSAAISRKSSRPRSPLGLDACLAMNSGRRNCLPFVLHDDPDAPLGNFVTVMWNRSNVSQHRPETHPVTNARTGDSDCKADRHVIHPRDATFWDNKTKSDRDRGY